MACAVKPTRKAVRVTAMSSRSAGRIRPLPNRISTTGWRITAVRTAIGTIT